MDVPLFEIQTLNSARFVFVTSFVIASGSSRTVLTNSKLTVNSRLAIRSFLSVWTTVLLRLSLLSIGSPDVYFDYNRGFSQKRFCHSLD